MSLSVGIVCPVEDMDASEGRVWRSQPEAVQCSTSAFDDVSLYKLCRRVPYSAPPSPLSAPGIARSVVAPFVAPVIASALVGLSGYLFDQLPDDLF